jgi:hypothetical protein
MSLVDHTERAAKRCCTRLAVEMDSDASMQPGDGHIGDHMSLALDPTEDPLAHHRNYVQRFRRALGSMQVGHHMAYDVVLQNFEKGFIGLSDYSGYDIPRECVRIVGTHLLHTSPPVVHLRACDIGPTQQVALADESSLFLDGQGCVFQRLEDRLPLWSREWLDASMPSRLQSKDEHLHAYEQMQIYLMGNRKETFQQSAVSYCMQHRVMCPVNPMWVLRCQRIHHHDDPATAVEKEMLDVGKYQAMCANYLAIKKDVNAPTPWWCAPRPLLNLSRDMYETLADVKSGHEPMVCHMAGIECTDYTQLGSRRRDAGPSNRAFAAYLTERKVAAESLSEHVFLMECHSSFPFARKFDPLFYTHQLVKCSVSPVCGGYPLPRTRLLGAGINQITHVWLGPDTEQAVQHSFMKFCSCTSSLCADDYLLADKEELVDFVRSMAARRRVKETWVEDLVNNVDSSWGDLLHTILPPCCVLKKHRYAELEAEKLANGKCVVRDLEVNPERGTVLEGVFPTIPTHGEVYSLSSGRLFTPRELLGAFGVDAYAELGGERGVSPLAGLISRFGIRTQRTLIGNSIHLPTFMAWFLFVMAHTVRRDCRLLPSISSASSSDHMNDACDEPGDFSLVA